MRIHKSEGASDDFPKGEPLPGKRLQPSSDHFVKGNGVKGSENLPKLLSDVKKKFRTTPAPLKPYMDEGWKLFQVLVNRLQG